MAVSAATVEVAVHDGEVFLDGHLETKNQLSLVEELTRDIDGVVDVAMSITYRYDDAHTHLPPAMGIDLTHERWR